MPWYTTADARRDAEKQAASKKRENSVRDNEDTFMNDMEREYRQLCRIDENPGVQGLAQLGRNSIERVTQLEKDLAAAVAERDNLRKCFAKACAKRAAAELRAEQAEARLAAIEAAPTVAKVCLSVMQGRYYVVEEVDANELPPLGTELIARPAKD